MAEETGSVWPVVWTLAFGGLLGGLINILRERRLAVPERDPAKTAWVSQVLTCALPILQGLAAAAVVPLFLSLTKSTLLEDSLRADVDRAVLLGLAIVASVSAKPFLDSITKRALQDIEETKNRVDDLESEIDEGSEPGAVGSMRSGVTSASNILADEHTNLLSALRSSKWIRRTAEGLSREVGRSPRDVAVDLDQLADWGYLKRHEPTPTQRRVRWSLLPNASERQGAHDSPAGQA